MNENIVETSVRNTGNLVRVMLGFLACSQKIEAEFQDVQKLMSGKTYKPYKVIKKIKKMIDSLFEVDNAASHEIENNPDIPHEVLLVIIDRIDQNNKILDILIRLYANIAEDLVEGD